MGRRTKEMGREGSAGRILERCERLGGISEEEGIILRPYGSQAMVRVNEVVAGWMEAAGMSVQRDAVGNLIGRYEGYDSGSGGRTLLLGSHLDTVRDAGKYDGILGVLLGLACVERLSERGERLPFAVEVVAFADEEGLRFGTTYLGSSVYAGAFDARLLEYRDAGGVTMREAISDFGGDPESLEGRDGEGVIGYLEAHIEQGPALEDRGLSVGVVSSITGLARVAVEFTGQAGHAGTTPMDGRRDALCAAAEFVLEVERAAKDEPGSVATVGELSALPGAGNVIPGGARLSLDVRHGEDAARRRLGNELRDRAEGIAAARGCGCEWRLLQENPAVPLDERLAGLLERAVSEAGVEPLRLPSGAGHDAAQLAQLAPAAMLFVRCREGISHNPAESVEEPDVAAALTVMENFLGLAAEA